MALLKQSTAYTRLFKMISSTDHLSLKASAAPVVNLCKAGAAFGAAAGTVTEIANGWYKVALTTADTGTLGDLAYYITGTGADDTDFCDQITADVDQTGDSFARLGAPAGASIAADLAEIEGETDTIITGVTVTTNNDKTGYALTAGEHTSIGNDVWDTARSGHVVAGSFGRSWQAVRDGTAQAGAATTITLDAGASAVDNFYNNGLLEIIGGTGIGQSRFVTGYVGSTKVATVNSAWKTNPDVTSVFSIEFFDAVPGAAAPTAAQVATAVWQDATAGDFTVASSIGKSLYTSGVVPGAAGGLFIAGTNAATTITTGLTAHIIGTVDTLTTYTGNTPQTGDCYARLGAPAGASIAADLAEIEGETDGIAAIPTSNPTAAAIATAVWQDTTAGDFTTALSVGKSVMNGVALGTGLTVARCTLTDTLTTYTGNTVQTGDSFARLGAPAGASIAADLAEIEGETDTLLAGVIVTTNNDKAGYSLLATGLNLVLVDTKTLPAALQYIAASTAGLVSGAGTGTELFKGLDAATTRLTVTVDASGNRSAITYG